MKQRIPGEVLKAHAQKFTAATAVNEMQWELIGDNRYQALTEWGHVEVFLRTCPALAFYSEEGIHEETFIGPCVGALLTEVSRQRRKVAA